MYKIFRKLFIYLLILSFILPSFFIITYAKDAGGSVERSDSIDTAKLINYETLGFYINNQIANDNPTDNFKNGNLNFEFNYISKDNDIKLKDGDKVSVMVYPVDYSKNFLQTDYTFSKKNQVYNSIGNKGVIADLDMSSRCGAVLTFKNIDGANNVKINMSIPFNIDTEAVFNYFNSHKDETSTTANFNILVNNKVKKSFVLNFKRPMPENITKPELLKTNGRKGEDILYNLYLKTELNVPNELIIFDTPDVNNAIEGPIQFFRPIEFKGIYNPLFTAAANESSYTENNSKYPMKINVYDIYYLTDNGIATYKDTVNYKLETSQVEGVFNGNSGKSVKVPENILLVKHYGSKLTSEENNMLNGKGGLYKKVAKGIKIDIQNFVGENFTSGGYLTIVYNTKVKNKSSIITSNGPEYRNSFSYYGQEIPTCKDGDSNCVPIKFEASDGNSLGYTDTGSVEGEATFSYTQAIPLSGDLLVNTGNISSEWNTEHNSIFNIIDLKSDVNYKLVFNANLNNLSNDNESITNIKIDNLNAFIVEFTLPSGMSYSTDKKISLNSSKYFEIDSANTKTDGNKLIIPIKFTDQVQTKEVNLLNDFINKYLNGNFEIIIPGNKFNDSGEIIKDNSDFVAKASVKLKLTGKYNENKNFLLEGNAIQLDNGRDFTQDKNDNNIQLTIKYMKKTPTPTPTPTPTSTTSHKTSKTNNNSSNNTKSNKIKTPDSIIDNKLNIKDHYAYMFGYPDATFRPERQMTRAEVTAMFARLMNYQPALTKEYPVSYNDINRKDWYFRAVEFMKENGIVTGYPDGNFKPNEYITRAEFATMASRFDKLSHTEYAKFSDVAGNYWASKYINSAVAKGWVKGYPDGTFKPERDISRAEVVTVTNHMLYREADKEFVDKNEEKLIKFVDLKDKNYWAYYNIIEATDGHNYHRRGSGIGEIWEELNHKEFRFAVVGRYKFNN